MIEKGDIAKSEEIKTATEELKATKKELVKLYKAIEDANAKIEEGILEGEMRK